MLLSRVTETTPFRHGQFSGQYADNYRASKPYTVDDEWKVVTRFERYGGGKYRQADYAVSITWEDVERIIETLCEAGCPDAIALHEARKLATAVKELGWQQPEIASTPEATAA